MFDVKKNFPGKFENKECRLGCPEIEDINHLLKCKKIEEKEVNIDINKISHGNLRELKTNAKEILKRLKKRNEIVTKVDQMNKRKRKIESNDNINKHTKRKKIKTID